MSLVSTGNLRTMCVCVWGGRGTMWDNVGHRGTVGG